MLVCRRIGFLGSMAEKAGSACCSVAAARCVSVYGWADQMPHMPENRGGMDLYARQWPAMHNMYGRAHGDMLCRYEGNVEDLGLDFTVDDETFGQVQSCILAALAILCIQQA